MTRQEPNVRYERRTVSVKSLRNYWGERWDSNPRRLESQSRALPTELRSPLLQKMRVANINQFWSRRDQFLNVSYY